MIGVVDFYLVSNYLKYETNEVNAAIIPVFFCFHGKKKEILTDTKFIQNSDIVCSLD